MKMHDQRRRNFLHLVECDVGVQGYRGVHLKTTWHAAWRVVEEELWRSYTAAAAALAVRDSDGRIRIAETCASGNLAVDDPRAVDEDTLFDLASLTKIVATAPVILKLCEGGAIEFDAPLSRYLPTWRPNPPEWTVTADWTGTPGRTSAGLEHVTIRRLLTHTSGLTNATRAYARAGVETGAAVGTREYADTVRKLILSAAPAFPPGSRVQHTDWGFILLGMAAEAVTGEKLDSLARRLVFEPLGMRGACFKPDSDTLRERGAAASWEAFPPGPEATADDLFSWKWRRQHRPAREPGAVHDNTAHALGGVAGHAGLFASVKDLALFVAAWLGNGMSMDGRRWLRPETVAMATSDQTFLHADRHSDPDSGSNSNRTLSERQQSSYTLTEYQRRGFGWLLNGAESLSAETTEGTAQGTQGRRTAQNTTFFGRKLSPSAYGHTGFTGTALWVDPALGLGLVLLTNAVHLSRGAGVIQRVRRGFVDALL